MAKNLNSQFSNLELDGTLTMLEKRLSNLDNKVNALVLENNELHKRNGKKINRVMMMISKNKQKKKEETPTYLIIVIVVSLIALGVIGFLAFKHLKGSKNSIGDSTVKSITDSI